MFAGYKNSHILDFLQHNSRRSFYSYFSLRKKKHGEVFYKNSCLIVLQLINSDIKLTSYSVVHLPQYIY